MVDQTLQLKLSFPGEPTTQVTAIVREWSLVDRIRRGIIFMALTWLLAGMTLPIPGLHFIGPPLLLLAGPFLGVFRFMEKARLKSMKGSCPRCKVDREFQLDLRFSGPRSFTCDGCGNLIQLEQA